MNDNRQRNGDSDELSFPCSRPIKLAYLSIAQRQRNRRTAWFTEDDADVGTAPGQLAGGHTIVSTARSLLWSYHLNMRKRSARRG